MSITPLPSTSYILNAHFNFSSGVPLDVTSMASRNSWETERNYYQCRLLSGFCVDGYLGVKVCGQSRIQIVTATNRRRNEHHTPCEGNSICWWWWWSVQVTVWISVATIEWAVIQHATLVDGWLVGWLDRWIDAPLWKHPARTRNTNDRPTRGTSGMNILFPS